MNEQQAPVVFKTEASLWEMLKDKSKRWDARKWDMADDRMHRLSMGHTERLPVSRSGTPVYVPDERLVAFENKETGAILTFEFLGIEFAPWAVGWAFLKLGRLDAVDSEDDELPW